ncbi:hypothetical protein HYALB_00008045 [Hymenoscyphus albidus]|uniref:PH domain-containing protein n=1 Tax=Hymenoscyphus albidus TaxID=595503 RepID=A0A9N9Q1T9_9HELO|nr:hypothetical protein HYALB_00008045 [Hymenoscyphus albidus]
MKYSCIPRSHSHSKKSRGQEAASTATSPPNPPTRITPTMSGSPGLPGTHPVTMPLRSATSMSDDAAVPEVDPSSTSGLLAERLQAWKHAVGYLEDYVTATEKVEKLYAKEYEKILKACDYLHTINNPLKEGHHFDQGLGGIAGLFENMRQNTQGLANTHLETEQNIKGTVLPILDRLHKEIKAKNKELSSGAAKGAKEVDKARNNTQKFIELLGQQTASYESTGGKMTAQDDPYVVRRGVLHRLSAQVLHENNNKHDLIAIQNNFATFEHHVIEVIQQALMAFNQFVSGQAQKQQELYSNMLATAQAIPGEFEWMNFVSRNGSILIDPNSPDRTVESIHFPNMDHQSTKPLIEGTLERKSRNKLSMSGYSTGYYVITPSKFLHEFKSNDNFAKDPTPELSIYLPDAVIGATNGEKFNVKGKDLSGGIGSKLSGSSEIAFKAHSPSDAQKWHEIIKSSSSASGPGLLHTNSIAASSMGSTPGSPMSSVDKTSSQQTQGITGQETVASPVSATPMSPIDKKPSPPAAEKS